MLGGVIQNMVNGLGSAWPVSFLVRETLSQCDTYGGMIASLEGGSLMAPTYLTVAGTGQGEGCIITRDRTESLARRMLCEDGPLIQVNMDYFNLIAGTAADWQDICSSRYRYFVAYRAITSRKESITPEDLWTLLSKRPCLAPDTVYTVSMHPKSGNYVTRRKVTSAHTKLGQRKWDGFIKKCSAEFKKSGCFV